LDWLTFELMQINKLLCIIYNVVDGKTTYEMQFSLARTYELT